MTPTTAFATEEALATYDQLKRVRSLARKLATAETYEDMVRFSTRLERQIARYNDLVAVEESSVRSNTATLLPEYVWKP